MNAEVTDLATQHHDQDAERPNQRTQDHAAGSSPVTVAPAAPPSRPARPSARIDHVESPSRKGDVEVPHKERVRWRLALHLIWLLWTVIVLAFLLVGSSRWTRVSFNDVRALFELMFTALVALVGSAVGFYYGTADGGGDADE